MALCRRVATAKSSNIIFIQNPELNPFAGVELLFADFPGHPIRVSVLPT
jgi:hypothetical protein